MTQAQVTSVTCSTTLLASESRKVGSMQKHLLWLPLILMAVFASAAISTNAQSAFGVRANVPFDFNVGDKTIPAGRITARSINGSDGPMSISNFAESKHAFRATRQLYKESSSSQAKLVFHKYGNRYYLAEVWVPGSRVCELITSKSERALQREFRPAKNLAKDIQPERVIVLADMQ